MNKTATKTGLVVCLVLLADRAAELLSQAEWLVPVIAGIVIYHLNKRLKNASNTDS